MDNIILNDAYTARDFTPKGIVIVYEDDKVIFKKQNLIVGSGRQHIVNKLLGLSDNFNIVGGEVWLGTNGTLPSPGDTSGTISAVETLKTVIQDDTSGDSGYLSSLSGDSIGFKISLKNLEASNVDIKEIGILCKDSSTFKLFSRLVFDTQVFRTGKKYNIEYFVYF